MSRLDKYFEAANAVKLADSAEALRERSFALAELMNEASLEIERLSERCSKQRRELRRLNTVIAATRGAASWFRDNWNSAIETSPQAKARLHLRNNKLRQDLTFAEQKIARLEKMLAERSAAE